jgi:hypothetical protein
MAIKLQAVLISIVLILVISPILCRNAFGDEFVADMVDQSRRDTVTNKIYVKGANYRIETEEEGKQIVILVDREANLTRICNMDEKSYMEIPSDDIKSLMNDPFQSLKITLDTPGTERKTLESETVNGVECVKQVVLWGGAPFYTYYISEKYDLPLKIIRGNSEKVVELRNIEEKEIDDAMFQIPDGFSVTKESEEKK